MTSKDVEKARPRKIMKELGVSGLSRWGGKVTEQFLPELRGTAGRRVFKQMGTDPTISALLFAIRQIIQAATWDTRPHKEDSSEDGKKAAQFVDEALNDMSRSWTSTVSGICSMMQYGFDYREICYKQRNGRYSKTPSEYNDGRIGLKKLAGRSQLTIDEWKFDSHGGVHGAVQHDVQGDKEIWLPIEKCLLFRTEENIDNPEGNSILSGAYTSWFFLRNFREIEGIGCERDLTGIPKVRVPAELLTNSEFATELQNWKNLISNLRVDEMDGLILPFDPQNPELYDVTLMASPGKKTFDTDKIIERLKAEMASTCLTDFILLGHANVGSFALARSKQDALNIAISGWLRLIAGVINSHLIPKLMMVNEEFRNLEYYPEIVPVMPKVPSYAELAEMVRALAFASFHISSNKPILNSILGSYGLPELSDDEYNELVDNVVDGKMLPGKADDVNEEPDNNEDIGGAESLSIKVEEEEKTKGD